MNDLVIRRALLADAEAICTLSRDELGYAYPVEKTRVKLRAALGNAAQAVFVAEQTGRVVGYIHAEDYNTLYADPMKNILGIAVCSACRKQGIGKRLLEAVEQWAADTGAAGIRLSSGERRQDAHVFYERCGYTSTKMQKYFVKRL